MTHNDDAHGLMELVEELDELFKNWHYGNVASKKLSLKFIAAWPQLRAALTPAPSGEARKDAARYQQLFEAELLFVGEWATEEAAASGEGPWVMLMKEQADITLDAALASLDTKEG